MYKKKIIYLFSRPLFHSLIQGGAIVWQQHVLTTPMVTLIGFPFLGILFINAFIWSCSPETESPPTQSMKINVIPRRRRCSLLGLYPFSLQTLFTRPATGLSFILPPPLPRHPHSLPSRGPVLKTGGEPEVTVSASPRADSHLIEVWLSELCLPECVTKP